MQAIQVVFDESTLAHLDATEEVQRAGRSAVLRRVTEEFLRQRRKQQIAEQYHRAYADSDGSGEDWEDWEEQGDWPGGQEHFRAEAKAEGLIEGQAKLLLRQLTFKFGPLDSATREQISSASAEQLAVWGERLLVAPTLAEVFAVS